MNGKDLHDAMAFVGHDLISMAETTKFSPGPQRALLAAAACLALYIGLSTAILHGPPAPTQEPSAPPAAESIAEETEPAADPPAEAMPASAKDSFFSCFPQLSQASMEAYVQAHPEVLGQGWEKLNINQTGPGSNGTEIQTIHGDPVLAVDGEQQILLIRVSGENYRGVLAIANDAARLQLLPSSQLGISGETVGQIAQAHNGLLAINGSAFLDGDGSGNGGLLAGYAMCGGIAYHENEHMSEPYCRLEIDSEGQFRLADTQDAVGGTTVHAVEYGPALIENGNVLVDETCEFMGIHPRSVIGQGQNGEIMMLVIEGRMPDYSHGTNVVQCAELLARYNCQTAVNLIGGSSAILWYDGAYVTKCSNPFLPEGRPMPTAFVLSAE